MGDGIVVNIGVLWQQDHPIGGHRGEEGRILNFSNNRGLVLLSLGELHTHRTGDVGVAGTAAGVVAAGAVGVLLVLTATVVVGVSHGWIVLLDLMNVMI